MAQSDTDTSSAQISKKRSILKHDSLELISDVGRIRGVLKKDSSYDETFRRPILKNNVDDSEDNSPRSVIILTLVPGESELYPSYNAAPEKIGKDSEVYFEALSTW